MGTIDGPGSATFYFGTRRDFKLGDLIEAVSFTESLDAAAWESELAPGDGPGRIFMVEPTGPHSGAPELESKSPIRAEWYGSEEPLRVTGEVTDSEGRPLRLYHGTKADLKPGDLISPGHSANFGKESRLAGFVYAAGTLDAAIWGAELALGDGSGRIYVVEPTGLIMDDPNLTNARFPGNPTKSYRPREPLRVTGEVTDWQGHPAEVIEVMKGGLATLKEQGVEPIDD